MSAGIVLPGTISTLKPSYCSFQFTLPTLLPTLISPLKFHKTSYRTKPTNAIKTNTKNTFINSETFYDLLGISETGTLSEIKQAYKHLARKYHPDVSPPDQNEEYTKRFIKVKEAYETLADPITRALYDRDIASGLHLAFSARTQFHYNKEWQREWQSQLEKLKRRSMNKNLAVENMSWAARIRRQKEAAINSCSFYGWTKIESYCETDKS